MPRLVTSVAAAICALVVSAAGVSAQDDPPKIDPKAVEIVTAAAGYLAAQPRMAVNWFVSQDDVLDGREKITRFRSGFNVYDREAGFYSYSEAGPRTREVFFDGVSVSIVDLDENAYVSAPFAGGFDDLVARMRTEYGITVPIWALMSRTAETELMRDVEHASYLGTTRIAGRVVHHLAFASYENDWQVWVDADPEAPLVTMIVGTDPYSVGWPQYRVYLSDWDFDPEMTEDMFSYAPTPDVARMAWPKIRPGEVRPPAATDQ